jgi:ornithine carbamoyltransferase
VHEAAGIVRDMARAGLSLRMFDTGLAVSLFRDKSTRTRYAFRAACNLLGLATEELDESTSQVAHGETARETAAMVVASHRGGRHPRRHVPGRGPPGMTECRPARSRRAVGARVCSLARPAVLNLQCDLDHPTQSLADLGHLAHHVRRLERPPGKKLVMSWAHSPSYGKPLSVPQGSSR